MAFEQHIQTIAAGQQFDGSAGKGRFFDNPTDDRTGTKIVRIGMYVGAEAKNVAIQIVSEDNMRLDVLRLTGNTNLSILVLGTIPLDVTEHLEIITTGATSAMRAEVVEEDLKG